MKLSLKIAGAFFLVLTTLLSIQAWMHTSRFAEFHERELEDDLVLLASTLAAAADRFAESGASHDEVVEYLRSADETRQRTKVQVKDSHDLSGGRERNASNGKAVWLTRLDGAFLVEAPFESPAGARWVSVRRSEAERVAFEADLLRRQVLVVFALVAVAVLGGWWIGRQLLEKPIQTMLEQIERVGDGDYSVPVRSASNDELGLLQGTLDAMTVRLEEMRQQLSQRQRQGNQLQHQLRHADRLSTVGKLASGLAHELGTPLNVVQGRAKMIAKAHAEHAPTAKNARIVAEQAERMSDLISELLSFSRRAPKKRSRVVPSQLVGQALTLMEMLADDGRVNIETSFSQDEPVLLDDQKVLQVLTNLIQNAIHAMPDGGRLLVGVKRLSFDAPPEPRCASGDYLEFTVSDSGVGMDPETLAQVLEPFFTTKNADRGTGLGLSVCDSIIQDLGGWFALESKLGEGSNFRFYIPLEGGDASSPLPDPTKDMVHEA